MRIQNDTVRIQCPALSESELLEWKSAPWSILENIDAAACARIRNISRSSILNDPNSRIVAVTMKQDRVARACYRPLDWDSEYFGYKMAHISLVDYLPKPERDIYLEPLIEKCIKSSEAEEIEFLSIRTDASDYSLLWALQDQQFKVMDCITDYLYQVNTSRTKCIHETSAVRKATDSDQLELKTLFGLAFENHFGRFNADRRLASSATRFYEDWITNALNGYTNLVLVYENNGRIDGAIALDFENEQAKLADIRFAELKIAAVHPHASRKGIGRTLIQAAHTILSNRGCQYISGPAHCANMGTSGMILAAGYRPRSAMYTLHRWA